MALLNLNKTELEFVAQIGGSNPANQTFVIKCANDDGTLDPKQLVGIDVRCGSNHTMVLTPNSTVYSCGNGFEGQMGNLTTWATNIYFVQASVSNVAKIACAKENEYAILTNGNVWAWGNNMYGQCGDGSSGMKKTVPVKVSVISNASEVAGGDTHVLAIKGDGTIWAWGSNTYGELGLGDDDKRTYPIQIPGLSNIVKIAAGSGISVALTATGQVYEWGRNNGANTPQLVVGLTGITDISVGSRHIIATDGSNTLKLWGKNDFGQLGNGQLPGPDVTTPQALVMSANVSKIFAGANTSFVLLANGTVKCWGENTYAQLGLGHAVNQALPIDCPCGSGIVRISSGRDYTVFLYSDRTAKAQGKQEFGQLGNGTASNIVPPTFLLPVQGIYTEPVFANWTLSTQDIDTGISATWLTCTPTTGYVAVGDSGDVVTCVVNISGIFVSKSAWIKIVNQETNVVSQILARLIMTSGQPRIASNPTSITKELPFGGSAWQTTITITNTGFGVLSWTATKVSDGNFLSITPTSGGAGTVITATLNPTGLAIGNYYGHIYISDPNATNSPYDIPVTMRVSNMPLLGVSPQSIAMVGAAGSGINPTQTVDLTLSNYGAGEVCNWTGTINNDPLNCLSIVPVSGSLNVTNNYANSFLVTADMSKYAGLTTQTTLSANIVLTATAAVKVPSNVPFTIPVVVTINPHFAVVVTPDSLSFQSWIGGVQAPAQNINIDVINFMGWEAISDQAWLSCAPTNGAMDATASVTVSSAGLAAGVHTGTITVRKAGDPSIKDIVNVTFTLHSATLPQITVNPAALDIMEEVGGANPGAKSIVVTNTGAIGSVLAWTATKNVPWISSLTPNTGGHNVTMVVSFDISGLAIGNYTGQITVSDPNATNSPVIINVGLQILAVGSLKRTVNYYQVSGTGTITEGITTPHLVPVPANLDFVVELNGADSTKTTQITNTGGGALDWDVVLRSADEITTIFQADGGGYFSAALLDNGKIRMWGNNDRGQLGNGTGVSSSVPVNVSGVSNATMIASGCYHTLALLSDGTIKAWGDNTRGQLGDNTTINRTTPIVVQGINNAVRVAAGGEFSLAVLSDGTVKAWGRNVEGQLGDGTKVNRLTPVVVTGLTNVHSVKAGATHVIARLNDSTCKIWGANYWGQLGDGTTTEQLTPVVVTGLTNVVQVSCGNYHTVVRLTGNVLKAWGDNYYGQVGDGTSGNVRLSPVDVINISGVVGLACKDNFCLSVLASGMVKGWGDNRQGQLGDNTTVSKSSPTEVSLITEGQIVGCGWGHSLCLLKNNITVMAWGDNIRGQLGDGTVIDRLTPVEVQGIIDMASDVTWATITPLLGTDNTVCAVKIINSNLVAAGTYNAYAIFTDPAADNVPLSLPVVVTVTPGTPKIQVTPTSLDFGSKIIGSGNPTPKTITIANTSTGILTWSIVSGAAWCTVTPNSGQQGGAISVAINIATLGAGVHNTTIQISSNDVSSPTVTVPVTITIVDATPIIKVVPTTLAYQYLTGGSLPANQNITISNIGGGTLNWRVEANASWVTISPISGATTPATVSIGVSPVGLGGGVHNATLTIRDTVTPGVVSVNVSLTLTVITDVILDVDVETDILVFEAPVGGPNPANQTFTVINRGGGVLDWLLTEGMAYLSCTPTHGGNNVVVTVSVNVAGLTAGIYVSNITITDASTQIKVVKVYTIIGGGGAAKGDPKIEVTPTSLTFEAVVGGSNPAAKTITVNNVGDKQLEWQGISNQPWIGFFPTQGNDGTSVEVSVDVNKLATPFMAGTYTGNITIIDPGSVNQQVTVPITLILGEALTPILWVSDMLVVFDVLPPSGPLTRSFEIKNLGKSPMNWTIDKGIDYLDCNPMSGTGNTVITLTVANPNKPIGTYETEFRVISDGASGSPKVIHVVLNVVDLSKSIIKLNPNVITIEADKNEGLAQGTFVLDDLMQLYSQFTWTLERDWSWLSVSPSSGIGAPQTITATVNPDTMGIGVNIGSIIVISPQSVNSKAPGSGLWNPNVYLEGQESDEIPSDSMVIVKAKVTHKPKMETNLGVLLFSGNVGEAIPSQNFSILNLGGSNLKWAVSDSRDWITVTPTTGVTAKGGTSVISVFVDTTGMVAGTYLGTITVEGKGVESKSVLVRMVLTGVGELPPLLEVTPMQLVFTVNWTVSGPQIPMSKPLTIENIGGGVLRWQATPSESYIGLSLTSGIGNKMISVSVDPTTLSPNTTYEKNVKIVNQDNTNDTKEVLVRIITGEGIPKISITPEQINFTGKVGGVIPAPSSFVVTNLGGGTLNWSNVTNVGWLGISPDVGSGNAIIAVNVLSLSGLSQGAHNGKITINSNDPANPKKEILVILTLTEADPVMQVEPTSLIFHGMKTMANPIPQRVYVKNKGGGELKWLTAKNRDWITIENGSWVSGTYFKVLVDVELAGIGVNTGTITVSAPGVVDQTVNITFNVEQGPSIQLQPVVFPNNIKITAYEEEPIDNVTVTYRCPGAGVGVPWWTTVSQPAWITVIPDHATNDYQHTVLVFDSTGLSVGVHNATVTYRNSLDKSAVVSVELTILSKKGIITPYPASLEFNAMEGDILNPTPDIITIHNTGKAALNWNAHQTQGWIDISPMVGSDGNHIEVQVLIGGLGVGTYNGQIVIRDDDAGNSPVIVPVTLKIWKFIPGGLTTLSTLETEDGILKIDFPIPWPYQPGQVKDENRGRLREGKAYSYLNWIKPTFRIEFNSLAEWQKLHLERLFQTGLNMVYTPDKVRRPWERYKVFYDQSKFQLEPRQPEYWGEAWWEGVIVLTCV